MSILKSEKSSSSKTLFFILTALIIVSAQVLFAETEIEKAEKYLEKKIKQEEYVWVVADSQRVINADIAEAKLAINLGNKYSDNNIASLYFIILKNNFYPFKTADELLQSDEFIKALNPEFTLKTEDDAVMLRSVFYATDKETKSKIFQKNDKWFIIRQSWFGEYQYFEITTSPEGKITEITYRETELEVPEETMGMTVNTVFKNKDYKLSKKAKKRIAEILHKSYESYKFDFIPLKITGLKGDLKLFEGKLIITAQNDYGTSSSGYDFILIKNKDEYEIIQSKDNLTENKRVIEAFSKIYVIRNEEDAEKFEKVLDEIKPAEQNSKKHYLKDNIWCFVREKIFDDESGILVLTDKKGKILYIESFREIDGEAIMKMKLQDPDFKFDYALKLEEPTAKQITLNAKDALPVKVTFNADIVNAKGLYLATIVDGKMQGFSAGDMESPYTGRLEGKYFDNGKHSVKYVLLQSGEKDPAEAAAVAEIELTVEGGITADETRQLEDFAKNILETLRTEDIKKLSSYIVTEKQIKSIIAGINENTPEAEEIKKGLSEKDPQKITDNARTMFNNISDFFKMKKLDVKQIKFIDYRSKDQNATFSEFKFLSVSFIYQSDKLVGIINCDLALTPQGIFMFKFKPSDRLLPKEFMGY
ncbi:MAG: hypothetical protein CSB55_06900 [Candidatus Cloacimonadota bacterium]|nr:MAG: hypothetical protein CSB55_06900 [Candidatus Cloacimonadota bacterium]